MEAKIIPGIPSQETGSFHDSEKEKAFDTPESAAEAYEILKKRLLSVNDWKNYCDEKSADFKLYDTNGNPISRFAQEKDLIRINIPGPGNPESNGYECVRIDKLTSTETAPNELESLTIICVPTTDPNQTPESHISHFYSDLSTSNFRISRSTSAIKIGVYGRNEKPNMNTNFAGKVRNLMIAVGGMFGMSKIQWEVFAEKIIDF